MREWLRFRENPFVGRIPSEIGQLTGMIAQLELGDSLSGSIPTEIGQLWQFSFNAVINANSLSGPIPRYRKLSRSDG